MTDSDKTIETHDTEPSGPSEEAAPQPSIFGLPVAAYIKGGGTTTSAHDKRVMEIEADAERRRDQALAEKKLASAPIEEGGAKVFTHHLSSNANVEAGFVLLQYLTPKGDVRYENGEELQCLADVHMLSADELCLTLVCPSCKNRGIPQGQCQMRIRQKNKHFDLDVTKAGELIVFEGKPYRSAGVVRESDRFRCDQCGWAARIINNCVRPES